MSFAVPSNTIADRRVAPTLIDRLANGGVRALIALHLLAVLSLVMILAFSRPAAAEDFSCGARDLVAELKQSDPAAYAKLKAEGDKINNSGHRFWKLEKPGQKPDWLLGTIHLSDPRVTNMPDAAKAAYAASTTVVLESDEILDQIKASARLMVKPDLLMFSGKQTIRDFLNPADQIVLEDGLKKRGIPLGAVLKMKPYIISSMVAMSPCEMSRKAGGAPFLDQKLAVEGQATGKQVKGVETLAEQIEAMASLPIDFHVRSLVSIVRYPQYTADMMETTIGLYLTGDIGMVMPASIYFAPEKNDKDFQDMAQFEQRLITDRNHHMADRGEPILAAGNVFMAVGALHLVGEQGLVELLRKKGYTATPVM
jgi:uncharacterized protein YbaP (TraB family)